LLPQSFVWPQHIYDDKYGFSLGVGEKQTPIDTFGKQSLNEVRTCHRKAKELRAPTSLAGKWSV